MVASNPACSEQTGWPIGFWWSELSHPLLEFTERGYKVDVTSPEGGPLRADPWSDPRDESRYSAEDLISLGFINSPAHTRLVEETKPLADVRADDYDGALFVGGQGPMYTCRRCVTPFGATRSPAASRRARAAMSRCRITGRCRASPSTWGDAAARA
jgi:putative intracellular protease/amidase